MRWLALLSATGNGRTQSFGEALTLLAAAAQGLVLLVNKVPIGVGTDHTLCDARPPSTVACAWVRSLTQSHRGVPGLCS